MASLAFLASPTWGLILHPAGEPDASWTERPPDNVVGRWSYNASFVVIAPNWIITTQHQNTSPDTVEINGAPYSCHYDSQWTGGPNGNSDIRLIRLTTPTGENADLPHYAPPYQGTDESTAAETVIGGYGRGRESILSKRGTVYGYTWGTGENYHNLELRWGTNRVDSVGTISNSYTSDVLIGDFDQLGQDESTTYEGVAAEYDSGGGWFIKQGATWYVAGLTRGIEAHGTPWPANGESWFRYNLQPSTYDPDYMDAVRVSSYANWVSERMAQPFCTPPLAADINDDCRVDSIDLRLLAQGWLLKSCTAENGWCNNMDVTTDGSVNLVDFARMASNWLDCNLTPIEACN